MDDNHLHCILSLSIYLPCFPTRFRLSAWVWRILRRIYVTRNALPFFYYLCLYWNDLEYSSVLADPEIRKNCLRSFVFVLCRHSDGLTYVGSDTDWRYDDGRGSGTT